MSELIKLIHFSPVDVMGRVNILPVYSNPSRDERHLINSDEENKN